MKLKNILKKDKTAILGLDTAKLFVLAILALVIVSVVTLIVLDSLQDTVTGTTKLRNDTQSIINNTSAGLADFFSEVGTWFTLIGVVIIIMIIAVVIVVINRFGGGDGASGAFN